VINQFRTRRPARTLLGVEIEPVEHFDDDTVAQLLALQRAAHAVDHPDRPPQCSVAYPVGLRHPRPGSETRHRVVRDDGRIVAHLEVWLTTRDNRHMAGAELVVHPQHRRRGIGRAMMAAGFDIARQAGRTTLSAGALVSWGEGPARGEAGERFLEALGFRLALTEVLRRADVTALDPATEQQLYAGAQARATDYEIIGWIGRTPDELLDGLARLNSTFLTEAPTGELELENENLDPDFLRELDDAHLARGLFNCGVAARHRASGQIAANTLIGVPTEPGTSAGQWITLVAPEHRGHRLGLLVKLENHRQLRRERPAVRWIYTGNADVNAHMIAINELLGFQVVDAWREHQITL
jgi:GNAT superfamily N-acetyltransferase